MKRKIISLLLAGITFCSFSVPVYASTLAEEGYIDYVDYDYADSGYLNLNKCEDYFNKLNNSYEGYSNEADKTGVNKCLEKYKYFMAILLSNELKYGNEEFKNRLNEGNKNFEKKLQDAADMVHSVYQQNGGGSGAALDTPRQQCLVCQERCKELLNVAKEQSAKLDESEIKIVQKVKYDEQTKTGFKSAGNNEYGYLYQGRVLIDEWMEFEDGYRYFNKYGVMVHDTVIDGIRINSEGLAYDVHDKDDDSFYPSVNRNKDVKYIQHTFRVFGVPVKFKNVDTYNKKNDGAVKDTFCYKKWKVNEGDSDDYVVTYDNILGEDEDLDDDKVVGIIEVYRYKDRLSLGSNEE